MSLLIDECVPDSVAQFLAQRGHTVRYVRELLAGATPDAVIAKVGDKLSAIVVTWDRDFEKLVSRIPHGNRTAFRHLGRISFRCPEPRGRALIERWIDMVELHYQQCLMQSDFRMLVQIQDSGMKLM